MKIRYLFILRMFALCVSASAKASTKEVALTFDDAPTIITIDSQTLKHDRRDRDYKPPYLPNFAFPAGSVLSLHI